jgi:hypothetical protein
MSTLLLSGVDSAKTVMLFSDPHASLHGKSVCVITVLETEGQNVRFTVTRSAEAVRTTASVHDAIVHEMEASVPFAVTTHGNVELSTHGGKLCKPISSVHFRRIVDVVPHGVLIPEAFAQVLGNVSIEVAVAE